MPYSAPFITYTPPLFLNAPPHPTACVQHASLPPFLPQPHHLQPHVKKLPHPHAHCLLQTQLPVSTHASRPHFWSSPDGGPRLGLRDGMAVYQRHGPHQNQSAQRKQFGVRPQHHLTFTAPVVAVLLLFIVPHQLL